MEEKLSIALLHLIEDAEKNVTEEYLESLGISKKIFFESIENLKGRLPAFDEKNRVRFSSSNDDQEYVRTIKMLGIYEKFRTLSKQFSNKKYD